MNHTEALQLEAEARENAQNKFRALVTRRFARYDKKVAVVCRSCRSWSGQCTFSRCSRGALA